MKHAFLPAHLSEKPTTPTKAKSRPNLHQPLSSTFNGQEYSPMSFSRNRSQHDDQLSDTPGFPNKFGRAYFELHDDKSEAYLPVVLGSASESESRSQKISLNDPSNEFHSNVMNNINRNFKRNVKHVLFIRLKNRLEEVKGLREEIDQMVQRQNMFAQDALKEVAQEIEKWTKKAASPYKQQVLNQMMEKEQVIANLEAKAKDRDQQIGRLKKELEQEKNRVSQRSILKKTSSYSSMEGCSNCKLLDIKQSALKEELMRKEKEYEQLVIQNEKLQEYIFDMQQKIVGIDLEVEKRLHEQAKYLTFPAIAPASQSQDYLEIVRRLNDENAQLQEKYQKLEKKCLKEQQLKDWQKRLEEMEADYQRKQASLQDSLLSHEKLMQKLYQKEHQIILAQQNISSKIESLKRKEEELASWEVMLNQIPAEQHASLIPSVERYLQSSRRVLRQEGELNSFGKIQGKQEVIKMRHVESSNPYERNPSYQAVFIPTLPLKEVQYENPRQRVKTEFQGQQQIKKLTPSSNLHNQGVYSQIIKRNDDKNHRLKIRNESPAHDRIRSGMKFQINLPNSPQNYRQLSKNSRLNSHTKSGLISSTVPERRQRVQMSGVSSKLDKLREEIKRQMESIK